MWYLTFHSYKYLGTFKAENTNKHVNAKITKQEYIRTSPITKNQIISEIKTGKPVRQFCSEKFQSGHQPRDSKFVHNVKYAISKEHASGNRQNSADDVQNVINMLSKSSISEENCAICRKTSKCN
jgi:hypothetical protein